MKQVIKIDFVDFWPQFDKYNNYLTSLLSKYFTIEISKNPEFLIYSCYGSVHLSYSCYRIFYSSENQRVNWNACDYALTFDYLDDERHYRLPLWVWYNDPKLLLQKRPDATSTLISKKGFCNMVVSNPFSNKRIDFFHKLSKYKKVDSGGRYLNNIGVPVQDKMRFISEYKFTISFENSSYPGYTTEKIFEPMIADSIPLYWGNPEVGQDFNTKSFVSWHDFGNDEKFIEHIIQLDNDDALFCSLWEQPWYPDNKLPECVKDENVIAMFEKIFSQKGKSKPVAKSFRRYYYYAMNNWQKVEHILNDRFKYRKPFR